MRSIISSISDIVKALLVLSIYTLQELDCGADCIGACMRFQFGVRYVKMCVYIYKHTLQIVKSNTMEVPLLLHCFNL